MRDHQPQKPPRMSRTLIWDIARESGVSIGTVSRALNGKADVAEATREKILQIVRAKGYVSNQHARSLVNKRSSYIGFAVPVIDPYIAGFVQGAAEALEALGAHLVLCPTACRSDREMSLLQQLMRGGADGALIVMPAESSDELALLQHQHYPFVIIDPTLPVADDFYAVASANTSGACQAIEHLMALGHHRIGIITGTPSWCATIDRLAGCREAFSRAGRALDPDLVIEADFMQEGGLHAARRLLALPEPPTAIFAFNDAMAVGTLRAAEERGVQVPEQLSLVGFDDTALASATTPPLTTIKQPTYELGREGVNLLFHLLQGQQLEAHRLELPTRLIVRASTGACSVR
jgi:LacI family transcriptional regulator